MTEPTKRQKNEFYSLSDHATIDLIKEHVAKGREKYQRRYKTPEEKKNLFHRWHEFLYHYVMKYGTVSNDQAPIPNHLDAPESWSESNTLPVIDVVLEGDAGTGKTYSTCTWQTRNSNMIVNSVSNTGTQVFLNYAKERCAPDSLKMCELHPTNMAFYDIRFADHEVRRLLSEVENNAVYQNNLAMLANRKEPIGDEMMREHIMLSIWAWRAVLRDNLARMYETFDKGTNYQYRVRRHDRASSYDRINIPTPILAHETELLDMLEGGLRTKKKKRKPGFKHANDRIKRESFLRGMMKPEMRYDFCVDRFAQSCQRMDTVCQSQTKYKLLYELYGKTTKPLVPPCVLNGMTVHEEDGTQAGGYECLRKLLNICAWALYQPPQILDNVPVMVYSGSSTQSSSIGASVSALALVGCPAKLRDDTMAVKAGFFRRNVNDYSNADFRGFRATPLMMENNVADEEGYAPLGLLHHEVPESSVENPAVRPENVRFYCQHKDVKSYIDRQNNGVMPAVHIRDVVFFSHLLVPTDWKGLRALPSSLEGLSNLSAEQAEQNRKAAWQAKRSVYKDKVGKEPWPVLNYEGDDAGFNPSQDVLLYEMFEKRGIGKEDLHPLSASTRHKRQIELGLKKKKKHDDDDDDEETERLEELMNKIEEPTYQQQEHRRVPSEIHEKEYGNMIASSSCRSKGEAMRHIIGPASQLLSREEHLEKGRWRSLLRMALGDGSKIQKHILPGSKAEELVGEYEMAPDLDMVVEIADVDYDDDDNKEGGNHHRGRIYYRGLYMGYRRKIKYTKNSPVVQQGGRQTRLSPLGLKISPARLLEVRDGEFGESDVKFDVLMVAAMIGSLTHECVQDMVGKQVAKCDVKIVLDMMTDQQDDELSKQRAELKRLFQVVSRFEKDLFEKLMRWKTEGSSKLEHVLVWAMGQYKLLLHKIVESLPPSTAAYPREIYSRDTDLEKFLRPHDRPMSSARGKSGGEGNMVLFGVKSDFVGDVQRRTPTGGLLPLSRRRNQHALMCEMTDYRLNHAPRLEKYFQMALDDYHPDEMTRRSGVVLVDDTLIASIEYPCTRNPSWKMLLYGDNNNNGPKSEPEKLAEAVRARLGVLARFTAPIPAKQKRQDAPLITWNGCFTATPMANLMNMPLGYADKRNFEAPKQSTCYISGNREITPIGGREQWKKETPERVNAFTHADTLAYMCLPNPLCSVSACTTKFAQGRTYPNGVIFSFEKIIHRKTDNMGDPLVGLTRSNDVDKLHISGLRALNQHATKPAVVRNRNKNRHLQEARIRCMNFRF